MDKLGTALGTGLNWLGSNVPQFLGGPQANWGTPFMPADPGAITSGLGASSDPTISSYFTGGPSTDPNAPVPPESIAGPIASAIGPTGGVGFNPAMGSEAAFSTLGTDVTDPATGAPLGGTPASPSFWQSLFGGGGGGGGAGAGGAGGRSPWPAALSMLASGGVDIAKFLQQRSLLNQNSLQEAEQNALKGQKAALERNVFPGVKAQLQETGNINAPYLETQAYTAAIAPYVQSQEQAAMENWLRANAIALGLYPGDLGNPLGGFTSPNIFGGSQYA